MVGTGPVTAAPVRLRALDGWRAISILSVLGGHLIPLGPHRLAINETAARFGMSVFFTLSGFLITGALLKNPSVGAFLVRRAFRIVPLAWLFILLVLPAAHAPLSAYPAHLFFYANLPPFWLTQLTGHMWSLCVEVQFYLGIAVLFAVFGRRGLIALPFLSAAITLGRILSGAEVSIVTYARVDEILAGATLALAVEGMLGTRPGRLLRAASPALLLTVTLVSCSPLAGPFNYARPYLASSLVGLSLFRPERVSTRWLEGRLLAWIAEISYALYVVHPLTMHGWFGPADKLRLYLRRPLGIGLTFALAYLSTRYYERPWLAVGKRWASHLGAAERGAFGHRDTAAAPTPQRSATPIGLRGSTPSARR